MRNLYLLRGVPGSGKSTLGQAIANICLSADDYHICDGEYKFDFTRMKAAHADCLDRCRIAMEMGIAEIAVANTFTRDWEFSPYVALAEVQGYVVHSLIVENRHGGANIHEVPPATIQKMKDRFQVKL